MKRKEEIVKICTRNFEIFKQYQMLGVDFGIVICLTPEGGGDVVEDRTKMSEELSGSLKITSREKSPEAGRLLSCHGGVNLLGRHKRKSCT